MNKFDTFFGLLDEALIDEVSFSDATGVPRRTIAAWRKKQSGDEIRLSLAYARLRELLDKRPSLLKTYPTAI